MANLIIKSSADNLVLQGSDASPAITVGATGTTTFAENATLSGTANNIGTVTAGTIGTGVTKKIHAFSAYNSVADCAIAHNTWVEASATGTWVENFDSLGHYASGRFTPTVQGIYLCGYAVMMTTLDKGEYLRAEIRRNSLETATNVYAHSRQYSHENSDYPQGVVGSAIIQLDTNDYVSFWIAHNEGGSQNMTTNVTQFWGTYIGTV